MQNHRFRHFLAAHWLDRRYKAMECFPRAAEAILRSKAVVEDIGQVFEAPRQTKTAVSLAELDQEDVNSLATEITNYTNAKPLVLAKGEEWSAETAMHCLQKFPMLQKIAGRLWSIPASSAPSERVFSLMGRIDRMSHSLLTEDHFEHHCFIKANWGNL